MNRRSVLLALSTFLAGCGAGGEERSMPTEMTVPRPDPRPRTTSTNRQTAGPTASPTATATSTPPRTPTPTRTPTATATPTPADPGTIHGTVGEWIIYEQDGGTVSVRLRAYRTRETLPVATSDEADGELEAPGDATWVETLVSIRSHDSTQTFSYDQWAVEDFQEDRFVPDPEAMDEVRGTLPEVVVLRSGTLEEYAVHFALEYTRDLTFYVEPYGDVVAPTVVIEG